MEVNTSDYIKTLSPTMQLMLAAYKQEIIDEVGPVQYDNGFRIGMSSNTDIIKQELESQIAKRYEQRLKSQQTRIANLERENRELKAAKKDKLKPTKD